MTTQPPVEGPGTGTYEHNPDHIAQAVAHLIEFFRKPRNQEVMRIMGQEVQNLEDFYQDFITAFDVNTAVGDQLDKVGARVGELRDDRTDDDYRGAIRVRILVNSSNGTLPELIDILYAAMPALISGGLDVREAYPASLFFQIIDTFDGIDPADLMRLMRQAKPAGVKLHASVVDLSDTTPVFTWHTVVNANSASTSPYTFATLNGATYPGGRLTRVLD